MLRPETWRLRMKGRYVFTDLEIEGVKREGREQEGDVKSCNSAGTLAEGLKEIRRAMAESYVCGRGAKPGREERKDQTTSLRDTGALSARQRRMPGGGEGGAAERTGRDTWLVLRSLLGSTMVVCISESRISPSMRCRPQAPQASFGTDDSGRGCWQFASSPPNPKTWSQQRHKGGSWEFRRAKL
jgi:hypothetical protein